MLVCISSSVVSVHWTGMDGRWRWVCGQRGRGAAGVMPTVSPVLQEEETRRRDYRQVVIDVNRLQYTARLHVNQRWEEISWKIYKWRLRRRLRLQVDRIRDVAFKANDCCHRLSPRDGVSPIVVVATDSDQ